MSDIAEVNARSFLGVLLGYVELEAVLFLSKYQTCFGFKSDEPAYLHPYPCTELSPIADLE
jgi:hypothetical protein